MKAITSLLLQCCFLTLLIACGGNAEQKVQSVSVKLDTVAANGERSFFQYPGRVFAGSDADVAFRVSGKIQRILVNDGDAVKKGQLIAEMDPSDYQVQLSATEAKYKQVKAEAERVMALYKDGGATPNDYDKAVYGLQQIEALYQHHKDELSYTRLYAPFDGFVQKQFFKEHETVAAGMPVVSLIGNGTPEVEINLPAAEYIRRSSFSHYQCTFDLYPGKVYALQLVGITPKANANQLYTMRLKFDKIEGPVPSPGMNTMVSIFYSDDVEQSLLVPSTALLHAEGKSCVYIYQPRTKTVKLCPVKCVRPLSDGYTVVTSSEVKVGDLIVSAGVHALKNGEKVEPLAPISATNIGGLL